MSTFSGLNTAYTGLVAARQGINVVGQNMVNMNSEGYTRQRSVQSANGSLAQVGPLFGQVKPGQGVSVTGIQRLGDNLLDAKARTSVAASGYWGVRANELSTLQASLNEPGTTGISAQLTKVWAAWSGVGLKTGDASASAVLIEESKALANQIAVGYTAVDTQWSQLRTDTVGLASELNHAASEVASLNGLIRSTIAAGGSANELIDQRNLRITTISTLTGASVRHMADGTAEVLVGGNALVSGDKSYAVAVTGTPAMLGAAANPVKLSWVTRPDVPVTLDGGEIAGALSTLSAANATGTGGALAEAAAKYNGFAQEIADKVNAVHRTGTLPDGVTTGLDFFAVTAGVPAALGLTVIPTGVGGIATAKPGAGGADGSIADAIASLGKAADSPDKSWSTIVTGIAVATRTGLQQSVVADLSTKAAVGNQLANSSVDLDDENISLLTFQTAYQAAARLMTSVDETLDTLINRTGIVGR